MPPKNGGKAQQQQGKKNKKNKEDEEFDKLLSDLKKVTKARSSERAKEEQQREEQRKKHEELLQKRRNEDAARERELVEQMQRQQRQQEFQQLFQQLLQAQRSFLDEPNTEFKGETVDTNPHFSAAAGAMQGWRANMEDEHVIDVAFPGGAADSAEGLFCVFDGHSGKKCATECRKRFPAVLRQHCTEAAGGGHAIDFEAAFLELDAQLDRELGEASGCTAVAVHVSPARIACGSVGDSRAVLCRAGAAFDLSQDHKPMLPAERERIEAAGGHVEENRVNGQLAMSRAMGDFTYKRQAGRSATEQLVIPLPDVVATERQADDRYIVVACDGIFDVLTNAEVIAFVNERKAEGMANEAICEGLCRRCLAPAGPGGQPARAEGTDNMTVLIVDLK